MSSDPHDMVVGLSTPVFSYCDHGLAVDGHEVAVSCSLTLTVEFDPSLTWGIFGYFD